MKMSSVAAVAFVGLAVGFVPLAHPQAAGKGQAQMRDKDVMKHDVMMMDYDKDGAISKSEFMRRMEEHWNEMAAQHKGGKVTPKEAAATKLSPKEASELAKHIEEMNRQRAP